MADSMQMLMNVTVDQARRYMASQGSFLHREAERCSVFSIAWEGSPLSFYS